MLLATLCYLKRDGHTSMVYRNKKTHDIHEGKWNGLGGKFEPGKARKNASGASCWKSRRCAFGI